MCKKNVNAVTRLYDYVEIGSDALGRSLLQNQFDTICVQYESFEKPFIGGFYIVSQINLLGTSNEEEKASNAVSNETTLEFKIRITKVCLEKSKQYSWDVDTFEIDLSKEKVYNACVPFVNYTKISKISKIYLEPDDFDGEYVVKILVRDKTLSNDEKWVVQGISNLFVK